MKTNNTYLVIILFCASICFQANAQLLDNTFNTNGVWSRQIRTRSNSVNQIILQPDGKILYAGYTLNATLNDPSYFAIGRINGDGTTDNTFDTDGVVEYTFNTGGYDEAYSICYLNGKIYAAADNASSTVSDNLLVRLNTDGSIDNTFNSNGKISPVVESSSNGSIVVVKTNDNKLIVLGESSTTIPTFHLSAFKVDESANYISGFGNSGKTILNVISGSFSADDVEILSDNSILIIHDKDLIRIKSNGHLDSTFGVNGVLNLNSISSNSMNGISIQKDGKILLCNSDDTFKFSVYRLNSNGSVDNTFGTSGKVTVPFNGSSCTATTIVVDTTSLTGKIFVGGYSSYNTGTISYVALARISSTDGTLEAHAEFKPSNLNANAKDIILQTDGKILMAINSTGYSVEDLIVARINQNFTTVVATGVQESLSEYIGLNLFPNPASQNINIHSSSKIENVRVLDVMGNEILNFDANGNTQIDISSLPKGLYNFVIKTDKGVGTKKVSIQ